ncbi:MAG TPA: response regulator [Roseiflexaceae bacterium]|nr:response regulator [Roseiflexaceae bacterium]
MAQTVLIIDDETHVRWVLGRALEQAGYRVHSAPDGGSGLGLLQRAPVDLVLLDLTLRGERGLVVLRRLRERHPDLLVLILASASAFGEAVEAMQLGAADVLRKPPDAEQTRRKVAQALERRVAQQELARLAASQRTAPSFAALIGADARWQALLGQARQLSRAEGGLLLRGEPGSGRASLGRAIHAEGDGRNRPLVELDLRPLTDAARTLFGAGGVWDAAADGTLLLRGLPEALAIQPALASCLAERALEGGPRLLVVAAPEPALPGQIAGLLAARLELPPLRERPGDILLLAHHFAGFGGLSPGAAVLLERYSWPGNIAELRSMVERARALAGDRPIDIDALPSDLRTPAAMFVLPPEGLRLEEVEQTLIRQALARACGNKARAAELLGVSRATLLYRLEKYGISAA